MYKDIDSKKLLNRIEDIKNSLNTKIVIPWKIIITIFPICLIISFLIIGKLFYDTGIKYNTLYPEQIFQLILLMVLLATESWLLIALIIMGWREWTHSNPFKISIDATENKTSQLQDFTIAELTFSQEHLELHVEKIKTLRAIALFIVGIAISSQIFFSTIQHYINLFFHRSDQTSWKAIVQTLTIADSLAIATIIFILLSSSLIIRSYWETQRFSSILFFIRCAIARKTSNKNEHKESKFKQLQTRSTLQIVRFPKRPIRSPR